MSMGNDLPSGYGEGWLLVRNALMKVKAAVPWNPPVAEEGYLTTSNSV